MSQENNQEFYIDVCDSASNLLAELRTMFEDPSFQSVFVAAGKMGFRYNNETLKYSIEKLEEVLKKV